MSFTFSTALSGLRASTNSLGVTGNNIANANTTAFKSGDISFGDIFLRGAGSVQIGNGVRALRSNTDFSQGGLTEAGSPTSVAIQGNGFFVVNDRAGTPGYTRAGDFSLDREGYLVTPNGYQVQGYAAGNGRITPGTATSPIRIPIGDTMPPSVTTQTTMRVNLDSSAATGAQFSAPAQVYDSRGVSHTLELRFTRQTDGSYTLASTLDGNAATSSATAITFDSDGQLSSPATLTVTPDQTTLNGATLPVIDIPLRQTNMDGTPGATNFTSYAAASAVTATQQDGFGSGNLVSLSTDATGILSAVYSNGQTRAVAQFAIATFNAQGDLRHQGGNLYAETPSSGAPSIGTGNSGGRGELVGGALGPSHVDITTEVTELIVGQRCVQANSRVITTINQTLQDLLQIV